MSSTSSSTKLSPSSASDCNGLYLSGKSAWDANPELQVEASKLAKQLRNDYEADVRSRANNKH